MATPSSETAGHRRLLAPSSSSCSSSASSASTQYEHSPPTRSTKYEFKKAAEKKFRQRYVHLQQAYEQRLQALAAQVRHVVAELQSDVTIEYLQQDPLTHEYANARVAEILSECFTGEREKYIQVVSDQLAWQTRDLREAQQRLRVVKKRERIVHQQWLQSQNQVRELQQHVNKYRESCTDHQRELERLELLAREREQQRDEYCAEAEALRPVETSLATLQKEYEGFQVRAQNEREHERVTRDDLVTQIQQLKDERSQVEGERRALERDVQHLRQLVTLAEKKNEELTQLLRQVQAEEYGTRLRKLEQELVQQHHVNELLQRDNEQLTKKYEEFGVQVEAYMDEQAQVQANASAKASEREKKLQDELVSIKSQTAEALKTKHSELVRLADQLKFRQDALAKAELTGTALAERVAALEASLADEKMRSAKQAGELEKEVTQWRAAVDKEKERVKSVELQLAQTTQSYESRLSAVQEAAVQQQQQSLKERELEARTRWQNEFTAQQEARIEALKRKYDAAIESQQNELLQARHLAVDAAKSANEKVEQVRSLQQQQQDDAQVEARRRQQAQDADRLRTLEAERAKELKQQQKTLDERDRRVKELEKQLADMAEAMKKTLATQVKKKSDKSDTPSVVVVNVGSADELADSPHADTVGAQAMAVVQQRRASQQKRDAETIRSFQSRGADENNNNGNHAGTHDDCVPSAQHAAELAACEAKSSLAAEQRLQQQMQQFQEKKERELRNAMVNVRKGIQKLETSLAHEQSERKRVEIELLSERQAFVQLRGEVDELRDAKRVVAQRLQEANGLVGKLRDVVKLAEAKANASDQKMKEALQHRVDAEARVIQLQQEVETMNTKIKEESALQTATHEELRAARASEHESNEQNQHLRAEMTAAAATFDAQREETTRSAREELARATDEWKQTTKDLESQVENLQKKFQAELENSARDASLIHTLTTERDAARQDLERAKADLIKQKNEFNDLARMHRNLNEASAVKRHEVDSRLLEMAERNALLQKDLDSSRRKFTEALDAMRRQVATLKSDTLRLTREGVTKQLKAAWKTQRRLTLAQAEEIRLWHARVVEREALAAAVAMEVEREDWRTRLAAKELEMAALLSGQKVDDQAKYDQLVARLEAKTMEMKQKEAEISRHEKQMQDFERLVQRLEQERELQLLEQSQLAEQLSSSRVTTDRETEVKQQLQASIASASDVAQVLWNFIAKLMSELSLDPQKVLSDDAGKPVSTWRSPILASDLRRVMELVQEKMTGREREAADIAVTPLREELQHAKEALLALQTKVPTEDDGVARHLPWYVLVSRSIRLQMEQLRVEADTLRQSLSGHTTQTTEAKMEIERLQQLHAVLVFERDTLAHEMNVQAQTLHKRREGELQQLRDEFERKIEQLQRRQSADQQKAKEEHEIEMTQLKEALDSEKKTHAKLKQDVLVSKVEHDKLTSELQDRAIKLEKELEAVTDELAKWKRKAKLAASKSPGTPSRRPSVMFASSFHTDEDGSDHSYQSMFPPSRRPSSAMADLSNLMEQSLQDLRKDNEGISPQATPTRLLMQSPMQRLSARPSPLRIPVHPSPARKRPSLVPPPRLINTATSQLSTPPPSAPRSG